MKGIGRPRALLRATVAVRSIFVSASTAAVALTVPVVTTRAPPSKHFRWCRVTTASLVSQRSVEGHLTPPYPIAYLSSIFTIPPLWTVPNQVVYECPYPRMCLGTTEGGNGSVVECSKGATGPLCAVCQMGYYLRDSSAVCQSCDLSHNTDTWWVNYYCRTQSVAHDASHSPPPTAYSPPCTTTCLRKPAPCRPRRFIFPSLAVSFILLVAFVVYHRRERLTRWYMGHQYWVGDVIDRLSNIFVTFQVG